MTAIVDYFVIGTPHPAAAQSFYGTLFDRSSVRRRRSPTR